MLIPVHAQSLGFAAQPGRSRPTLRNGQETQAASLKVSSSCPDVAGKTSPLYDVLTAAHGRAAEDGNLIN